MQGQGSLRGYLAEAHPIGAGPTDGPKPPSELPSASADVSLSDEEKRIAKSMGVSEAEMLATKKANLSR